MARNLLHASKLWRRFKIGVQPGLHESFIMPTNLQQLQYFHNRSSLSGRHLQFYVHFIRPVLSDNIKNKSARYYSTPQRSNTFIGKIMQNLKEEAARSTEMKKSLEELKKDMENLSKSDTVTQARAKYQKIEEERARGAQKARQKFEQIKDKVSKTVEEAQHTEIVQKASKLTEEAKERVQQMGQTISQSAEGLVETRPAKAMRQISKEVGEGIQASALSGSRTKLYNPPEMLRMRKGVNPEAEQRIIEINSTATGMVVHKDSRFSQSWQNFKDNNPYVNKVLEWKTKLDESDHFVVRATLLLKDKLSDLLSPIFDSTDLSKTLTEICRIDPAFDKDKFMLELEYDIIPNVLEAMIRPDLEVLEVDNVDLSLGQVLEEGPVLFITFQAQVIECTYNLSGEVVEGNPDAVQRRNNVWVLCRDQNELNPREAWRLLEFTYSSSTQLL